MSILKKSLVIGVIFVAAALHAQELIKNGNFSEWNEQAPAAWSIASKGQKISKEESTGLDAAATALKVEITEAQGGKLGEIRQQVKATPNKEYTLTAWVKCSKPGTALIMVKLRQGRKELKRLNTKKASAEWQKIELKFNSAEADNIQILCRYKQKDNSVGAICLFTGISLK